MAPVPEGWLICTLTGVVVCSQCNAVNPADSRFCSQCGVSLSAACPACGSAVNAGSRFCNHCGAQIGPAEPAAAVPTAAAPVAERRVCSVLFADLVGFTPLSESRDPEEVRELLSRYFETTRTLIARYGGTVEKFIGDAVMAVWGAPVATEVDAERAVRAALDVVDAVAALGAEVGAPDLAARAGVVTGEVAVTIGAQNEGMVAGDAVNTAARVQSVSAPGTVFVDDATRRLCAAGIGFLSGGEHELKGKTEPLHLWQATHVLATMGGSQRIDGLEAPLAGRGAELRTIKELLHATVERRSPRLVVVTGAPGVGKTRLGWEFNKYVDGLAQMHVWHVGRCLSYGDGVAFWALAQAVRQRLGIAEEDSTEVAGQKLSLGVDSVVTEPREREFVAVRLGRLLGVVAEGDSGGAMAKEDLFAGWRTFFERLAAQDPVVWLVEDAQYADAGLVEFIDYLLDWTRDLPIFVLVFGRSELSEAFPRFGVGRNRSLLTLDPLDVSSMTDLIDALVPGMPTEARDAITAHAQGVPLFAVETIRALIDRDVVQPVEGVYRLVGDVGALTVPDSLHGLIASRLDALPTAVRSLAADAAVLGRSFPAEALVAVSEQDEEAVRRGLEELVRREVLSVSADPLSPERGAYEFAQQLVRQVAYDTLSRRDRKARHLAVAAHLRSAFADDGEEVSEVIGQHYRDALESVPDATDADRIRGDAVAMMVRAAERAHRTGAPRAAADAYGGAAKLVMDLPSTQAADLLRLAAHAAESAGDYETAVALAEQARALFAAAGEAQAAASIQVLAGRALGILGRGAEAHAQLTDALGVVRPLRNEDSVYAVTELANLETFLGLPNAMALTTEALDLAEAVGLQDRDLARVLINAGITYMTTDRSAVAGAMLREAARLAGRCGDSLHHGRALLNLSGSNPIVDPATSLAAAHESAEILRRIGARNLLGVAIGNALMALLLLGDWQSADAEYRRALDTEGLDDQQYLICPGVLLAVLRGDMAVAAARAEAYADVFVRSDAGQDIAQVALATAALAHGRRDWHEVLDRERIVLAQLGAIGLTSENTFWGWWFALDAALQLGDRLAVRELLDVLEPHPPGHLPSALRAGMDVARAYLAEGDDGTADEHYQLAVDTLRGLPAPYQLAITLLSRGRPDDIAEAVAIAERLGATPLAERAEVVLAHVS